MEVGCWRHGANKPHHLEHPLTEPPAILISHSARARARGRTVAGDDPLAPNEADGTGSCAHACADRSLDPG